MVDLIGESHICPFAESHRNGPSLSFRLAALGS